MRGDDNQDKRKRLHATPVGCGHWIAKHEDPTGDPGDVRGRPRHGDHGDGVAVLQAAGGSVEGDDRGEDGDREPGAEQRPMARARR